MHRIWAWGSRWPIACARRWSRYGWPASLGASGQELEATYYLGLMMNVYCHADAAEQARWFGDDISMKSDTFDLLDMSTARMVAFMLRRVGSHGSGVARARRLAAFPVAGMKQVLSFATTHCTLGSQFAEQIGLDEAVCVAIRQGYEQWDGKGYPSHLQGEEICLPARLVQLAGPVEVVARRRGVQAAVAVARRHRGTQFDPAVVDLFCSHAAELLDGLDRASDWDAVLGTEPQLSRRVSGAGPGPGPGGHGRPGRHEEPLPGRPLAGGGQPGHRGGARGRLSRR